MMSFEMSLTYNLPERRSPLYYIQVVEKYFDFIKNIAGQNHVFPIKIELILF